MMHTKMSAAALINTATHFVTFISFILCCILYSFILTIQDLYSCFRRVFHLLFQLRLIFSQSSRRVSCKNECGSTSVQLPAIKVTREDVGIVMKRLGLPHQEPFSSQDCIEIADVFEGREPSLAEVKEAFGMFDKNKDGFVDAEELKRMMSSLGLVGLSEQECERMIMVFDDDGDGRISFGEFVKLIEENVYC